MRRRFLVCVRRFLVCGRRFQTIDLARFQRIFVRKRTFEIYQGLSNVRFRTSSREDGSMGDATRSRT
ncbi:hypothetical protein COLSTE_01647 [Collinsella stercoris DSM 13279]|uniref:Uncharacterized protein n=1 Tax=Collinsella stercoris DSM 13279 TaxID=445975 RepID=B6GC28_9ACTN|nr:hypothetical protein COLSTE_01647 [Collinsella stercoris DSM 13279]